MGKKSRVVDVKFTNNLKNQIDSDKVAEDMTATEGQMCYKDKLLRDTLMTKNNLESSIYDYRHKLDANGEWKAFALDSEIASIYDLSQKTEDWLYDDGENVTKDEYLIKQENLDKLVNPIKQRMEQYMSLKQLLNHASLRFDGYQVEIPNNAEKYAHLTPEDQETILANVQKGRDYFRDAQQKLQSTTLNKAPPVNYNDLKNFLGEIEKACDVILKRPKPEPPKEEKKEEKKEEAKGDEKMQEEQTKAQNGETQKDGDKMDLE